MNWYKSASNLSKTASVTVEPSDSQKVYQPMNLGDMHWRLNDAFKAEIERVYDLVGKNGEMTRAAICELSPYTAQTEHYISEDPEESSGFFASVGTILLQSFAPIDPDEIAKNIDEWVDHMEAIDNFSITWERKNAPNKPISHSPEWIKKNGIDPNSGTMFAIRIHKNPSVNAPSIPSLNVANANWSVLYKLLFPNDDNSDKWHGSIGAATLEQAIKDAKVRLRQDSSAYTSPSTDSHNMEIPEDADPEEKARIIREQARNRSKGRVYDFGLSRGQLENYLSNLLSIVEYCSKHGVSSISWG